MNTAVPILQWCYIELISVEIKTGLLLFQISFLVKQAVTTTGSDLMDCHLWLRFTKTDL